MSSCMCERDVSRCRKISAALACLIFHWHDVSRLESTCEIQLVQFLYPNVWVSQLLQLTGTEDAYNRMIHENMSYCLACLEELRLRTSDPAIMPYIEGGCDFLHTLLILSFEGPFFRISCRACKRPGQLPPLCQGDRVSALETLLYLTELDVILEEQGLAQEPADLSWSVLAVLWEEVVFPEQFCSTH